ncbi:putative centromere protein F-like [Apostichopus japonicus]|uniref:Putative centromere protein F-like n=1 Tax=Stichopus japonicus TaxID=307972 RepID=A0A2G8LBV8_STIJA|nr:putative centromere protein F-like [Apostichopus japonicus]
MDLNISSYMVPITSKKDAREVEDIANRLQKVLSNVELMFEGEDDETSLITSERRQFQSRYGDITAQVDAREKERSEVIFLQMNVEDLNNAKVVSRGTDTNLYTAIGDERCLLLQVCKILKLNINYNSVCNHIEMTKMGFDKLQKLKEEMHSLASKGKPIQHLQEQKSNLKEKVVEKFKLLYSAKMLRSQNKSLGSHWKHAAEEIVNVLHRIRAEGESTIQDLEEELIRIEKAITRQAENMVKLEHTVQEKQKTIDTINKSMSVSNNENELLKSEVERYRDQVIMMKKELRKLRADGESQDSPESVDNHSQTFLSMVTLINAVNDEISAASMVNENSLKSQLPNDCQCSAEIPELLKKIDTLQQKIIDKETQMLKMDHQSIDTADSKEEAERRKDSKKPEGREHNMLPTFKIQMEPVVQDVPSEVSDVDYVHDDMKLRLLALTQDKEQLLMEMDKLREQNAQAAREIVTLKYASEQPYIATSSFPRTDQYGQRLEPSQPARKSLDSVNEQNVQSDVPSLAEEDKAEVKSDTLKSEPINDILHQSKVVTDRSKQGNSPDQLPHQNLRQNHQRNDYKTPAAYQTEWSSVQEKRRSQLHRVPMEGRTDQTGIVLPPVSSGNVSSKYMQFPTKGFLPLREAPRTQSKRQNSKVDAGMGPEAVENHENELQSFVSEIQSYSQYLKDAMDGEIYRMAQANEELRRRLSEQSLRQFDKLYSTLLGVPESLDETSSKSSEYSGQMTRGRIRAPKVPSPFTAQDAFATIKKGERIVQRREFEREENRMFTNIDIFSRSNMVNMNTNRYLCRLQNCVVIFSGSHQPQNDLSVYQATQRVNSATMKSRSEDQGHAGSFDKED